MSRPNGHANPEAGHQNKESGEPPVPLGQRPASRLTAKKVRQLVAELEVPFDPSTIEWRAVQTTRTSGMLRGQVMPYADQRAYTDRLNALVTPAGWTRRYTVHSTANFRRGRDQKIVAKVFVTCDLTIFGLGSHSATGEEWADDDNAATSAEAQSFKRACACVGLGRYLYNFTGIWVDLDERKRPKTPPKLPDWATPEGWRQGLRPQPQQPPEDQGSQNSKQAGCDGETDGSISERSVLIREIESMFRPLGNRLYRGVLKTVARAWQPSQVPDTTVLRKVLDAMRTADQWVNRLSSVLQQTGPEPLAGTLRSLQVKSLEHVETIEMLEKIVRALEAQQVAQP